MDLSGEFGGLWVSRKGNNHGVWVALEESRGFGMEL